MTISKLECVLCSSVLDAPTAQLGPNVCTALAYAPDYWESVEGAEVAIAINLAIKKGRPTHRAVVSQFMLCESAEWLNHPTFNDGLPLSAMEPEALRLVEHYHKKRIVDMMGKAYSAAHENIDQSAYIAHKLMVELESVL